MSLHDYLEEVLGRKASIRVLKTLTRYRGKVFTMRELARVAALSHPEVALVVKNLEKRGVVKLQPVGRAQQVMLNEESYILGAMVDPLIAAEKETLNHLISTMKPFFRGGTISSVALYGSVARGLEGEGSDIDLLIVSGDREFASDCAGRANAAVKSKFGVSVSPLIMDEASLIAKAKRDLTNSIMEAYVMVRGDDIRELVENVKISE